MKKVILVLLVLVFAAYIISSIALPVLGLDPNDFPPEYPPVPIPPWG